MITTGRYLRELIFPTISQTRHPMTDLKKKEMIIAKSLYNYVGRTGLGSEQSA